MWREGDSDEMKERGFKRRERQAGGNGDERREENGT